MANNQLRRSMRIREKRVVQNQRSQVLPDDILLEIFDFYLLSRLEMEAWKLLVHVCQRWRNLVFRSPRRLNLQLLCTNKTPIKDRLDIWPAFPLIILGGMNYSGTDNIIAALGQCNRIYQVNLLYLTSGNSEKLLAAMQVSFPRLTHLHLLSYSFDKALSALPDSFLGESAPSLQSFSLSAIPFPGLPKLLRSATHPVNLWLTDIPHSGYISPEAIVALISVLSGLKTLTLQFQSPQSRPDRQTQSLPPPKRSILPALDILYFKGATEYLEELVTHIDTPQLHCMQTTFFNQIDFDCPQLAKFINYTPALRALDEAHLQFNYSAVSINLRYRASQYGHDDLRIDISCSEPDWQLSSIEQVCHSPLPPLSVVEDLYIEYQSAGPWKNDAFKNTLWSELLLPFTAVKDLYLSREFALAIAGVLEEVVGGRITELLPCLQNIFVEGFELSEPFLFRENVGQFAAARLLSDHPIAISVWPRSS